MLTYTLLEETTRTGYYLFITSMSIIKIIETQ